jgi:N-carbamoyl-L-amino-acid hydrolase
LEAAGRRVRTFALDCRAGPFAQRPFRSLAHLKHALAHAVRTASTDAQLGLIRAHPELAGKAMVAKSLTAESTTSSRRRA